jgi:hypothetical protein
MTCTPEIKAGRRRFRESRSTFMFIWISLLCIDLKPVRNSSARFVWILARKDGALNVRCTMRMRFCASYISSFKTLFSVLGYIIPRVVTGEKNSPTVAHACRKRRLKWVLGAWGYNWATHSPGDINIETWSSRLGVGAQASNPVSIKN